MEMNEKIYFRYGDEHNIDVISVDMIENIYARLVDETTCSIFENRVLFALTKDFRYMRKMICGTSQGKNLESILFRKKNLYIYGAGIIGTRLVKIFSEMNWKGYIDKYKRGKINNYPIYNLMEFKSFEDVTIVISPIGKGEAIKKELLSLGILEENVIVLDELNKVAEQDIYFDESCIKYEFILNDSSFVDVGCYDAKEIKRYIEWSNNKSAVVYGFEPDISNFFVCEEVVKNYKNCKLYNIALSDSSGKLCFNSSLGSESSISNDGDFKIMTECLDVVLEGKKIGLIKMDVEGHEENVLLGAKKIISEQKPLLAISVYHKKTDIWRIPQVLLQLNSNYKFYLRHYSIGTAETVLYAIDESLLLDREDN